MHSYSSSFSNRQDVENQLAKGSDVKEYYFDMIKTIANHNQVNQVMTVSRVSNQVYRRPRVYEHIPLAVALYTTDARPWTESNKHIWEYKIQ